MKLLFIVKTQSSTPAHACILLQLTIVIVFYNIWQGALYIHVVVTSSPIRGSGIDVVSTSDCKHSSWAQQ